MAESLRDRQKAQIRAEIQRGALRLFAEHGFDAVTTEEIAAGVGHNTYVRYVPTKEGLLLGAFRGTGAAVVENLEHRPADESAENALRQAFLERSQAFVADEESVRHWRIAVRSAPDLLDQLAFVDPHDRDRLNKVVSDRMGTPTQDDIRPGLMVHTMLATAEFAYLRWLVSDDAEGLTLHQLTEQVLGDSARNAGSDGLRDCGPNAENWSSARLNAGRRARRRGATARHIVRFGVHPGQLVLVAFTWINVLITLWEISLSLRIRLVEQQYEQFVAIYRSREHDRVLDSFATPIRLRDVAKPSRCADVWSAYSLFDSAYSNNKSFGFWIDSCNGYLTLIPSILFIYGLTFDILPARALGIIFSIMCYGTVVYDAASIFNKEFRGHTLKNLALFISALNSLWTVGPIWGMVACIALIDSNSFGVVR